MSEFDLRRLADGYFCEFGEDVPIDEFVKVIDDELGVKRRAFLRSYISTLKVEQLLLVKNLIKTPKATLLIKAKRGPKPKVTPAKPIGGSAPLNLPRSEDIALQIKKNRERK